MRDKYKNKAEDMGFLVPESLFEHLLLENAQIAKEIFSAEEGEENEMNYEEFADYFKEAPEFLGKFAEWSVNFNMPLEQLDILYDAIKDLKTQNIPIDINPDEIRNPKELLKKLNSLENKEAEEHDSEEKETASPIVKSKIEKSEEKELAKELKNEENKNEKEGKQFYKKLNKDVPLLGYRLWLYAVFNRDVNGRPYVKFGETYNEHKEGAERYAAKQTLGKVSGQMEESQLIFCVDATELARSINDRFVHEKHQQFDNFVRKEMPGKSGDITNKWGATSKEIHLHDENESFEEIKKKWLDSIKELLNEDLYKEPITKYIARPFHKEMRKKISENKDDPEFDKYLLAAATGSGKEVTTLEQIIHIHDMLVDRGTININTVHVSCATIPATELELFEELSKVAGMNINATNISYTDFSRIKGYSLTSFANNYYKQLSDRAKIWFEKNITPVKSVSDIPANENFPHKVPVLFGSFNDLGMKAIDRGGEPSPKYEDLKERIGILAIGEAHKFLANISNKMWPAIKEKYNFKFLLLITGTPYDYIFNDTSDLYFPPEQRTLFTRSDLYDEKRRYLETGEGDSAFAKYPDIYYYKLDVADVIEKMKNNPEEPWEGDENGFTFQKFFEFDKKKKEFIYSDAIVYFFKRLLGINTKGKKDNLSIHNAPDLCEYAKKHIIVALPVGHSGVSVHEYIPKLEELLSDNGALGKYESFVSYDDELGDVKEVIEKDEHPTVIFTCNKLLTGTNIPAWGSILFLRPIGNSIKFFEQATGRVGRAKEGKNNVGVFLGNVNNVANLHVSVGEKIALERNPNTSFSEIKRKMLDNYFFFDSKDGKWEKFDMSRLDQALEDISGEVDYRFNLSLNKPKVPENFDLEFSFDMGQGSKEVHITDDQQSGEKNSEISSRLKQLKIQFDNARDKEKWYRNMIKNHLSRILIICLMKGFKSIGEFSDFIKNAIVTTDIETLDMIGPGAVYIPEYIDDPSQIDILYLNHWLDRITKETSKENSIEGIEERFKDINIDMDVHKLNKHVVFDPISVTNEICDKISDKLDKAKSILILEKNGAFLYSILNHIGINSLKRKRIKLLILDKLSKQIISYILGEELMKQIDIEYIKDIKNIKIMEKFDVVIGNPPYKEGLHLTFLDNAFEIAKDYVVFVEPASWLISEKEYKTKTKEEKIKQKIKNSIQEIDIINLNLSFKNAKLGTPGAIIYIDKNKNSPSFKSFDQMRNKTYYYNDINEISKWGNEKEYKSLKETIKKYISKNGSLLDLRNKPGNYYINFSQLRGNISMSDKNLFSNPDFFTLVPNGLKVDQSSGKHFHIAFETKEKAENCLNYIKTKFARFCLSILKIHNNIDRGELGIIPLLDFSKKWDDKDLYSYFNLSSSEINFIEENIPSY